MPRKSKKNHQPALVFNFGDPEPVISGSFYDQLGAYLLDNGEYYETPVPWVGVARLLKANAYHGPIIGFKTNVTMRGFSPSAALVRADMRKFVTDYMVFANAYFQKVFNFAGEVVELRHIPAINVRRLKKSDHYGVFDDKAQLQKYQPGEVLHIKNYDVSQNIYGLPEYLGAVQSMLLNEDATLFRRKYYKNGAHMGYIFYSSSPYLTTEDAGEIQKVVSSTKGIGNFRNLFLHTPNGREKDIQILPVGDFSTKDELEKIKNISRDDIIAAHRIPPALANIIPTAVGGLGDIGKANNVYRANEVEPIQEILLEINDCLPERLWIGFKKENSTSE